ncbi:LysM peptidoglycan-binding domain-containing protein [Lacinutrix sp.]|uniref:LysM peptidoglycan-binding domain-containing protein n=1 Tax=Lacinutrix sp. TaxID=1937692 RepID=UPI0025BC5A49|nr:LysM peptidoglycan-binding domain-containing protein [Lacinutrix sp.]
MKAIVFCLFGLLSLGLFAQEIEEEFLPIEVEGKEAYMSTKTGEFTFRAHSKTDATQLKTTPSGVVYTNITTHTIKKGETLFTVAKKNNVSIDEIKRYNKVASSNLKIGTPIKIVKKELVKSSSPVISYAGEERIIASLRPGESPGQFAAPPSVAEVENKVIETKKTEEKPSATVYKAKTSVKNPIFGLTSAKADNTQDNDDSINDLSKAISQEIKAAKTDKTVKAVKTEVIKEKIRVVEAPKTKVKVESKKEKLARLKAEMQALEAELDEETPSKKVIKQEVVKQEVRKEIKEEVKKVNTAVAQTKKEDANALELIKKSNPEATIEETANGRKVMVFENKPKAEESTAAKAKKAIASVRKTKEDVATSKVEALKKEKKVAAENNSKENTEETKTEANNFYTVEKGNSLWSIAKKHNMTVDAIKKLNNLKNNNLSVGQKLKVTSKK